MAAQTTVQQGAEDPAVTNFRRYLRIKTVEPDPDYGEIYMNRKIFSALKSFDAPLQHGF